MATKILVAFATRTGSTAEIAAEIGKELTTAGYPAETAEMKAVTSLAGYKAIVIGAPVYTGRILGDVARFAERFKGDLVHIPMAGFVTGIAPVYPKTGEISRFTDQLEKAFLPVACQSFCPKIVT